MELDKRFDEVVFPDVWIVRYKAALTTKKYRLQLERFSYVRPQTFLVAEHNHPLFELHFFPSGGGYMTIENREYAIKSKTFAITGPEIHHSQISRSEDLNEEFGLMMVIEKLDKENSTINDYIFSDLDNVLDVITQNKIYFGEDKNNVSDLLLQIYNMICNNKNSINLSLYMSMVMQVLILTAANISPLKRSLTDKMPISPDLNKIGYLDDVFRGYHVEMSQKIAAEKLQLSTRQLNRIMIKHFGMTFAQKYLDSRINLAVTLLQSGKNLTIDEIAQKLNFSSQQYFSKTFKKYYGMTAVQYRKNYQKNKGTSQR